jgi:RNA recognition motif-containing protein
MMRSYSNQERGSYHHSRYQRRTPPPIAAPRDIIVVVENLPDEYKPKDIRRLFLPFGNVDNKIRLSSGVARVTFTDMRSADECVKTLHGYPLSGKRLSLKFV